MIDARQYVIGKYKPFDFETIAVNTVIGLTASKLKVTPAPKQAFITAEGAQMRYTMDGTTPTTTVGHILLPMQSLLLEGYYQLNNFQIIKTGATNGEIQVSYLR